MWVRVSVCVGTGECVWVSNKCNQIIKVNPFAGAPRLLSGWGRYVFSKIHCTRSERAMIYLNVSADRGRTVDSSSIFSWRKTPRAVYSEHRSLPHERFGVS